LRSVRRETRVIDDVERMMLLRTFPGFSHLAPAEVAALAEPTRRRFFPAGAVLARAGDPPRSLHFVTDGEVRVSRHGHALGQFGPRSTVGGLAVIARDPDTPEIVAIRDAVTYEMMTDDLEDMFEDNFGVLLAVLRAIASASLDARRQLGPAAGFRQDGHSARCPARALDLVERIFFLRKTIVFARSRIEALAQLARSARELRLEAGSVLWRAGDPSAGVVFPVCGSVRATTPEGQEFLFRGGASLGGLDMIAGERRWYTAEIVDSLVGLELDAELFLDVLEDHHEMAREFLAALARELISLQEQLAGHDPDQ
jgi:CRP-like cAMP-binding protein